MVATAPATILIGPVWNICITACVHRVFISRVKTKRKMAFSVAKLLNSDASDRAQIDRLIEATGVLFGGSD